MVDPRSRARAQRLLSNTFRPEDLTDLFLFARDHCGGRQTVREIGHFVAHHNERTKGIVTEATRKWFAAGRYFITYNLPSVRARGGVNRDRMPPATKEYFKIAVKRIGKQIIAANTGLQQAFAEKLMSTLVDRLTQNEDGTWRLPKSLTTLEWRLIDCVSSFIRLEPAFPADRLCKEFLSTLTSNGLIDKKQIGDRNRLDTLIQLYAVSAMHHCVVDVGDGSTTQLNARFNSEINRIEVLAPIPDAVPGVPDADIASSMFTANVNPKLHCHEDLLANPNWDFEIELTPDGRLSPLRVAEPNASEPPS